MLRKREKMQLNHNLMLSFGALMALAYAAPSSAGTQDLMQITPDFLKPKGDMLDPKHTPNIEAPKSVLAGEWFPVTISIGHKAQHPSMAGHHVRWISLEAGGVEINRVYLHPVMAQPKVTFWIALPDEREYDADGRVTKQIGRTVTLRAVETPTHAAPFWAHHKIRVRSKK